MVLRFLHLVPGMIWQIAAAALLLGLAACADGDDLIDGLVGASDEAPVEGRREKVLQDADMSGQDDRVAIEPVFVPPAVTNPNWSQLGGSPSHVMQNLTLSRNLSPVFSVKAGRGSTDEGRLIFPPIVTWGQVYVLDTQAVVAAISVRDGRILWRSPLRNQDADEEALFGGGLASDGLRVYATTAHGAVVALDAASGKRIWRRDFDLPIRGAPTVANDIVIFADISNAVRAVSAIDGHELWSHPGTGEQASVLASTSPAVEGGYAVIPMTSGDISVVELTTGVPMWSESLRGHDVANALSLINNVAASPVIDGDKVIAMANAGRLAAFSLSQGRELWSQQLAGTQTSWVTGDYLFMIAGRDRLAAIALSNGAVKWWMTLPGEGEWSGPVMAGGRLLAVSSEGMLAEVSPQDGLLMRRSEIGDAFHVAPVVANGRIYFLDDDGTLTAMQ